MSILGVEDERKIADSLKTGLEQAGYEVEVSHSGEDAFFLLNEKQYDLVLLDWMLPGRSGIEVLKLVRDRQIQTPVLILTAKDDLEDRVCGLDAGADDYLVKPFDFPELLARIRSLLRRDQIHRKNSKLVYDGLEVNLRERSVLRNNDEIELTNKEFDLLVYLCKHQGAVVSREMLTKDVWKIQSRATPMDSVIDVHIARLRKKIDSPYPNKLIKTVRGVGFRLQT